MPKLLFHTTITALMSCAVIALASSDPVLAVPVMLSPDTDHGTCSIGFRVNEGGAELRSGPSLDHPVIAILDAGHVVSGCDHQIGWEGIIDGQDETCSVGISVEIARAYDGPCPSGWVNSKFLTSIYG